MKKDRRDFVIKKKGKKVRKKPSKKVLILSLSCVAAVLVIVTVALCLWFFVFKKEEEYFSGYTSIQSISKATKTLTLPDGVSVTEYDVVNDIFIIESSHTELNTQKTVTLYGFASKDKKYVSPRYNSVISVKGDYAIVTQTTASDYISGNLYIGLIKFRGEGAEDEPIALTDFSIMYNSTNPEQFYFCGDYLCVMGDLNTPSSQAAYSSFYDYKTQNQPLLCFRTRYGYDPIGGTNYSYLQFDNYLVAKSNTAAYFFDIKRDYVQGYLELSSTSSYLSPYASGSDYTVGLSVLYMGNGWFVRYASQTSASPFTGYKFCYQSIDVTGGATLVFARTVTDFYNVKTGITKNIPAVYAILEVANKYTVGDFAATANSYNNNLSSPDDYPCMNPADMIADGYSILYYFYQPYIDYTEFSGLDSLVGSEAAQTYDKETLRDIMRAQGKETFCILDKNMDVIDPETLFPVVTVDGTGFETADPYFDINFGDAVLYTEEGKKTLLYADSATQYAVVGVKSGRATIASLDIATAKMTDSNDTGIRYGAATADGKIIVDCLYNRLSAFYGDYAVGIRIVGENALYFRIDLQGREEQITDMYMLKDGVYIYESGEYVGLKNYAGEVLIPAQCDSISLSDNYMVNGVYQLSYAIVTSNGSTSIFVLE